MEFCARDIPCAMMAINNATDYVHDWCVPYGAETDFKICQQKWK